MKYAIIITPTLKTEEFRTAREADARYFELLLSGVDAAHLHQCRWRNNHWEVYF